MALNDLALLHILRDLTNTLNWTVQQIDVLRQQFPAGLPEHFQLHSQSKEAVEQLATIHGLGLRFDSMIREIESGLR